VDDHDAIRRSLTDPPAFAAVFDRHFGTIHRYLARRAGTQVADDLASEVFTVAFARRASYELERVSALPWLYGIASNLLRANHRADRRDLALLSRVWEPDRSPPFEEEVDTGIDARRRVRELQAPLAALTEDDVTTLLLYAWEELSYTEIAEVQGIPVGTVRSRLNRVRRRLREPAAAPATSKGHQQTEAEGGH